jgi:hypothetical protein
VTKRTHSVRRIGAPFSVGKFGGLGLFEPGSVRKDTLAYAGDQDFRREHPVDPEQLELHGVATSLGGGVDEGKRAGEITAVVARSNENRRSQHGDSFRFNAF